MKSTPFAISLRNLNGNMAIFTPALTRFSIGLSRIVAGCHGREAAESELRSLLSGFSGAFFGLYSFKVMEAA